MTAVRVTWIDSAGDPDPVCPCELPEPMELVSVGHLVEDEDDRVTIAQDRLPDGRWRWVSTIPRCAVREIERL